MMEILHYAAVKILISTPKKEAYGNIIDDIGKPCGDTVIISSKCPYILSEKNTKLVWRHNK